MAIFFYANSHPYPCVLKRADSAWERTLLPGQTVTFSADPDTWLEVYSAEWAGCVLSDRIPCRHLQRGSRAETATQTPTPAVPPTPDTISVLTAAA